MNVSDVIHELDIFVWKTFAVIKWKLAKEIFSVTRGLASFS